MACEDRKTLQAEYQEKVQEFVKSVVKLREYTCDIPQVEYMVLLNLTQRIRKDCEAAQRALQRHVIEHHC
jgi:hypothetical protein